MSHEGCLERACLGAALEHLSTITAMRSWASSPPARRAWLLGRMTDILFRRTQKTIFTAAPVRLRSCAPHWRPQRPCAAAWRCAGPARSAASGRGRPRAAPLAGPGAAPLQPRAHSALALPVPAGACTPCRHAHSHHWLSGECQSREGAFHAQQRLQATANVRQCCCVTPLGSQPGSDAPGVNHGSIPAAPPPLLRVCASAGPGAGCAALSRAAAAVPPPCCPAGAPCCARAGCHQLPRQLRPLPAALPRAAPGVARPQRRPRRRHLLPQPLKKKFMTVFAAAKQHFMAAPAQQESRTCGAGSGR